MPEKKVTEKKAKKKAPLAKARNQRLAPGIYRFGRGKMYHKKGLFIKIQKSKENASKDKKEKLFKKQPQRIKEVPIGGDKNGSTRKIRIKKLPAYYATELKPKKRPSKNFFSKHKRSLRPTLTPGTVCIVLAGIHKGKKVVFLKQLSTGLCLVTGPFKYNGCPLRRINQIYLIATQTKIDLSAMKVPKALDDKFFNRKKEKKVKKDDVFEKKTEKYTPSEERKKFQIEVDGLVMKAIKAREDKGMLKQYLSSMFGLRNGQYPHAMKF